jgi:hypothetical protein
MSDHGALNLERPLGLCMCGCGQLTRVPTKNDARHGHVAGVPVPFAQGHNRRLRGDLWDVEDTGFTTPCRLWKHSRNPGGYALFRGGRDHGDGSMLVHRQHYQQKHGPVPEGLDLDHLCRVRRCVNPDHVEPVTRAENVRRGGRTILTLEQVQEIRESTDSYRSLARKFGVKHSTIWGVRSGSNWSAS